MNNKRKENKKRKRHLLLALLMILLTGAILSTGTYAWFTANKTVTVQDITVNVASSNGLQISVDGIAFKTVISNDDINNAHTTYPGAKNQLPSTGASMVPVSTINKVNTSNGFLDMYRGEIVGNAQGDNILTAEKTEETNGTTGDFIAFDLFLQVTKETKIYLTDFSKVAASGADTGIRNASRIAFVYQGYKPTGTESSQIQGLKATGDTYATESLPTEPTTKIWEPNFDIHTQAALANAALYGDKVYGMGKVPALTSSPQLDYYGVKAPIPQDQNIPIDSMNPTYFQKVVPYLATPEAGIQSSAYSDLMTLNPGINKVRVYMWVEGQDVDCENNASGGGITYSLQLSVLDKAGAGA